MRRLMKSLLILALGAGVAVPAAALADLYRWRDSETGSTRYSNVAPPWHREGARVRGPAVEVIAAPKPNPAATATAPRNEPDRPAAGRRPPRALPEFDGKRRALLDRLASVPNLPDAATATREMQVAMTAYRDLSAEMDRADPDGAAARQALDQPLLQRIGEAFARRFGAAGARPAAPAGPAVPAAPAARAR